MSCPFSSVGKAGSYAIYCERGDCVELIHVGFVMRRSTGGVFGCEMLLSGRKSEDL